MNVHVLAPAAAYHPGDQVQYECDDGSAQISGDMQRCCKIDGQVDGQPPQCKRKVFDYHPKVVTIYGQSALSIMHHTAMLLQ